MKWILYWAILVSGEGFSTGKSEFKTEADCESASKMVSSMESVNIGRGLTIMKCEAPGMVVRNNIIYGIEPFDTDLKAEMPIDTHEFRRNR